VTDRQRAIEVISECLSAAEIEFAQPEHAAFAVNLPGQRRLKTACWLDVGTTSLAIQAFVMRRPDENDAEVHRWLLAHNTRMFGVAWSIDDVGDIYLSGRWPLAAVTADSIDQLLGCVLDYADSAFNRLLELGFGSSIQREWAWRVSRGESLANLQAFSDFVRRSRGDD
jgi:hypothetical protein